MRFDTKMPAPNAVAASSTSTFKLPIGRRYHELLLIGTGTAFTPADITEARVLLNEQVVQRFSGDDRNVFNLFDGRDEAATAPGRIELVLPFDRYGLLDRAAEEATALNTGSKDKDGKSITSFSLEIDLGAGATGTPKLELYATQSEAIEGGPGAIPFIVKRTIDYAGADSYDISDLPRGGLSYQFLDRLFLKPSANTLNNFQVLANDTKLFERTAAVNERRQRDGVRVPQAGWYVIDRTEHGYGGDPFDMRGLNDFRLKLDTGAALTLKAYQHYIGSLSD